MLDYLGTLSHWKTMESATKTLCDARLSVETWKESFKSITECSTVAASTSASIISCFGHGAEFTRMAVQGSIAKEAGAGASALGTATDLQTDPIAFAAMESPATAVTADS